MRVAIIADTHMPRGSRRLPAPCLERLSGAELIIHLGDFSTAAVLGDLRRLGPPVEAVHGNVDCQALRRELGERKVIEVAGERIGLIHDAGPRRGRIERLRREFPNTAAVLFGHSHLPLHEERGGFQIFNPGSPTERRRAPGRSMGMADVASGRVRFQHVRLD